MPDLARGVYEHLVTRWLDDRLRSLDSDLVSRGPLDPADAHEVLARHVAALTRRALRALAGDDAFALKRQIELTNRIASAIATVAPETTGADDLVATSRELLLADRRP